MALTLWATQSLASRDILIIVLARAEGWDAPRPMPLPHPPPRPSRLPPLHTPPPPPTHARARDLVYRILRAKWAEPRSMGMGSK